MTRAQFAFAMLGTALAAGSLLYLRGTRDMGPPTDLVAALYLGITIAAVRFREHDLARPTRWRTIYVSVLAVPCWLFVRSPFVSQYPLNQQQFVEAQVVLGGLALFLILSTPATISLLAAKSREAPGTQS